MIAELFNVEPTLKVVLGGRVATRFQNSLISFGFPTVRSLRRVLQSF